jgi:TolA-binding protein
VYSRPEVATFVSDRFVPVRVHVKENPEAFQQLGQQFNAQWTPTVLIVDGTGTERHRIEGFLPADDFAAQLALGLARGAFARGDFEEAARAYADVVARFPAGDAAAEAMYWAGVSRYKATGDAAALAETAERLTREYQDTSWAKKASVWR